MPNGLPDCFCIIQQDLWDEALAIDVLLQGIHKRLLLKYTLMSLENR